MTVLTIQRTAGRLLPRRDFLQAGLLGPLGLSMLAPRLSRGSTPRAAQNGFGEEAEFPAIDTVQIAQRELRIVGSRNGTLEDARQAITWMERGTIRPSIAGVFPLERINDALRQVREGKAQGRVVIRIRD